MIKPSIKQQIKQKPYLSECGYTVQCENVAIGQVCIRTKDFNNVTLTKLDLVVLLEKMS